MSSISNRFYIQCMEDGSTLHGQLLSTKSLTQAWTGQAAVPNWSSAGAANRPLIYVDLLNGSTKVTPDSGGKWYYNGTEIVFESTVTSQSIGGVTYWGYQQVNSGTFFLTGTESTITNPLGGSPALGIIGNIASASNVDIDTVTYRGAYTMGGASVGFAATAQIRITSTSAAGIFGMIEFVGSNIITEKNQNVTMYGRLFSADGTEVGGTAFTTLWYTPEEHAGQTIHIGDTDYYNAVQVNEAQMTDNLVVRCLFQYSSGGTTLTCSAYANIDDQTDPEQMYVQHNGGYDNGETLKPGGSSTWYMWVGTQTDSAVDETWTHFYVKLLNAAGEVVATDISGIPPVGADQQTRELPVDDRTHKASITVTYDQVRQYFTGYMTAIIIAEK